MPDVLNGTRCDPELRQKHVENSKAGWDNVSLHPSIGCLFAAVALTEERNRDASLTRQLGMRRILCVRDPQPNGRFQAALSSIFHEQAKMDREPTLSDMRGSIQMVRAGSVSFSRIPLHPAPY